MTEITDLSTTDASNTAISGFSTEGTIANMSTMDNVIQAVAGLLARSIRTNVFRFLDNTDDTKKVKLDLSGLPTATERTWTAPNKSGTLAMTTDFRSVALPSYIVNGSMTVSQENDNTLGTTNGYFAADQWAMYFTAATAAMSFQRIQVRTLSNAVNQLEYKCTTAKGSLGASDNVLITQPIEGSWFQQAGFGTANAEQLIMRFQVSLPAGLYHWHFANSAGNRHCSVPFTIAGGEANTAVVKEIVIPPDTSGTWLTAEGVIGIVADLVLAAGATVTGGTASTWGGTTYYAASTQFNILSSTSNVARLADVGLKFDPDATGVYGQYEVGETDAVYRSERYFCNLVKDGVVGGRPFTGMSTTTTVCSFSASVPVALAISPAIGQVGCNVVVAGSAFAISSVSCSYLGGTSLAVSATLAAPATANLVAQLRIDNATNHIRIAARLL